MEEERSVGREAYQSLGSAVEGMPVVSPELGVGAVQRGVALGLGLLDAVRGLVVSHLDGCSGQFDVGVPYPFRCALRVWLCWDEFLDSARGRQYVCGNNESRGRRR